MSFKVGDWVITSKDCYHPNAIGKVIHVSRWGGCYVSNGEELPVHYINDENKLFNLYFPKKHLKSYSKEQQLEFVFE